MFFKIQYIKYFSLRHHVVEVVKVAAEGVRSRHWEHWTEIQGAGGGWIMSPPSASRAEPGDKRKVGL